MAFVGPLPLPDGDLLIDLASRAQEDHRRHSFAANRAVSSARNGFLDGVQSSPIEGVAMPDAATIRDGQWPENPMAAAGAAFTWLTAGPHPVYVDGRLFDYLPDRDIPVDELRDMLLDECCPRETWDQVWSHVIIKARLSSDVWKIVAVGMALPMLSKVSMRLTAKFADERYDVCAEMLRGFVDALNTVDLDQGRIMIRLRWAAYRAGRRALNEAIDGPTPVPCAFRSAEPRRPFGHPDLVLARAVEAGVLSPTEAELIGETRLQGITLSEWAAAYGLSYGQVQRGRHRAEARLAIWLSATRDERDPDDPTGTDAIASASANEATAVRLSRWVSKKAAPTRSDLPPDSGLLGCG
jgi:hypothetical protein